MTKYSGYMGKVLMVDLSKSLVSEYPWSDEDRELYIGAKAMASKIMFDNFTGKETAFSEDNLIIVSTGPLTGTGAPCSNRFNISTLSPLTGITTSSNCGGNFGYYLKKAGIDALVIRGKCPVPTWIEIKNDKFFFHEAGDLRGMKVSQSQEELQRRMNEARKCRVKCGMLSIGPAGENMVKYAAVISGERAAGRAGVGAVFGSKNLKAMVATGNHEVPVFDPEKTTKLYQKWTDTLRKHPLTGNQLPKMGTAGLVSPMQMRGILSTRNYAYGQYEHFDKVSGEVLAEDYNIVNKGCMSCPIKCARTVNVEGQEVKGPELETLGLLGGGIVNDNLELILKWNYELDELGMDTISAASTLAWAMEANEQGLWKNGLSFGKTANISKTFENIAYRRGIGNELAEGSRWLSEKYGGKDFAIQSKGLELAAYEPRRSVGQGLGYAVSNRGGCHLNGGYLVIVENLGLNADPQTPHAKADFCMFMQDLMESVSMTGQCLFTSYAVFPSFLISKPNSVVTKTVNKVIPYLGPVVRILNKFPEIASFHLFLVPHTKAIEYATGMKCNLARFIRAGERSYNVERAVNAKFGVSAAMDTLPKRLTNVPQDPKDPSTRVPLEVMKKVYYEARGWGKNGLPTEEKLRKMKII
ncbi:MAG: aldehyde ferredoxin oxidoreductase family protein [Oscillospiraceae bacterium]|nr:aldehyde ferredoxin oxidoreductase family protein [Oscillospiraceae bacterium]